MFEQAQRQSVNVVECLAPWRSPVGDDGSRPGGLKNSRPRTQQGASLILALGILAFLAVIIGAMVMLSSASSRRIGAYTQVRDSRYVGDGAIKTAINWAKDNPGVAVDPAYFGKDASGMDPNDRCVLQVQDAKMGPVTASCFTSPDSGSGLPTQQGLNPPEGLLLLGTRHNEPGPYSTNGCTGDWASGVWADIKAKVTGNGQDWVGSSEKSLAVKGLQRTVNGNCADYTRTFNPIKIQGPVVAAGKVDATKGTLQVHSATAGSYGEIYARYGCSGSIYRMKGTTSAANCLAWDSAATHGPNDRPLDQDPARINNSQTPIGDIDAQYLPVGFNADGSAITGSIVNTARTTAYVYDPSFTSTDQSVPINLKPITKPATGCTAAGVSNAQAIIFLPGWYKDVHVLNQYTADPSCKDRTIWFAPDAGPDRVLLTEDDATGPFYLDFGTSSYSGPGLYNEAGAGKKTVGCGSMPARAIASRWCIGGSDTSETRVVVGSPKGWSPLSVPTTSGASTTDPGSGHSGGQVTVSLEKMATVDDLDSNVWDKYITNPLTRPWQGLSNAKDFTTNTYATYKPCDVNFFNWFHVYCPTFGSRTLRLAGVSPQATRGPVSLPGAPNGKINVTLKYGQNHVAMQAGLSPKIEIETIDKLGRNKSCGSFDLSSVVEWSGSGPMPVVSLNDGDQITLANNCGAREEINAYRLYLLVKGSTWNNNGPQVYLGGARISYESFMGAQFPYPGEDGSTGVAAQSDCDDTALAGGQLIFPGQSHVYVADGSLEVCAGVYPGGAAQAASHQVIGIYGVPEVTSAKVGTVDLTLKGNEDKGFKGSTSDAAARLVIGEPGLVDGLENNTFAARSNDAKLATLSYEFGCSILSCRPGNHIWTGLDVTFKKFTVPTGYHVSRIAARTSVKQAQDGDGNPGPKRACQEDWIVSDILGCGEGIADGIVLNNGGGSGVEVQPKSALNALKWTQNAERPEYLLYDESLGTQPVPNHPSKGSMVDQLTSDSGLGIRWVGRIRCVEILVYTCAGTSIDTLDGIELDVQIAPNDTSKPVLRPQSGCITAHPNYMGGAANPDCALVRANMWDLQSTGDGNWLCSTFNVACDTSLRGKWNGRVSVKGTIYAPSSAIEVDDQDIAYPLATRGIILRHLLLTGWGLRNGYSDFVISNESDNTPTPRSTVFTACTQSASRRNDKKPCDAAAGDKVLSQAGVNFAVPDEATVPTGRQANVPIVKWWSDRLK